MEIFESVRDVWPAEKPLGIRISATDGIEGGWNINESAELCSELKRLGCDYATVSSGVLSGAQKIAISEGHQVALATRIRIETGLPVMAIGMINRAEHTDQIIATGQADMIAIAPEECSSTPIGPGERRSHLKRKSIRHLNT